MAYPTNGFSSTPVSFHTGLTDHVENGLTINGTLTVEIDGSAYALTDDQVQDLFSAVALAAKGYITGLFPAAETQTTSVNYTAATSISLDS